MHIIAYTIHMPRNNHLKLERFLQSPQTCGEKRRYPNREQAEQVRKEQEIITPGLRLRTYKCLNCGGWHLTRHKDVL